MAPEHLVSDAVTADAVTIEAVTSVAVTSVEAAPNAEASREATRVPLIDRLALDLVAASPAAASVPEHRQLEMYSRPLQLDFADDDTRDPAGDLPLAEIAGACRAFVALDAAIAPRDPAREGGPSWERYRALPRAGGADKLAAELFRVLRLVFVVTHDRTSYVETKRGLVCFDRFDEWSTLTMKITPAGLRLLQSAVTYWLGARRLPYPDAYVEAMLAEYWADIVGEIHAFADENKSLYQFRRKLALNRHLRLDCDNPKTRISGDMLHIEIGDAYRDARRFPIDFFIVHDDALHIVPVEALDGGRLPLAQLATWRARLAAGEPLPAAFRSRFARGRRF